MTLTLLTDSIDLRGLENAYRLHVRQKAEKAGSTVVYMVDDILYEEDPKTGIRRVLQTESGQ